MKQVLIIDDDQKNIFALEATLKSRGISVQSVTSASDGMQWLVQNPETGVVLLDMMMPEMDGYETIALIRNHPALRNLPIIAVTAQAMSGDREKCLAAGADEYVSKPVDVDRLLLILQKHLHQKQA
jgi:CheY-like chemotaxis protein